MLRRRKADKEAAMNKWFNELLVNKLEVFDSIISNKGSDMSGYAVGGKLSLADVSIYTFLVEYFDNTEGVLKAYENCPKLKAIVKTVGENEKIKQWIETRPVGSY